jgi:hypothetical protein
MKALVYYCRWQGVALRLRGRDETAVWGHLVSVNEDGSESSQSFRFELQNGRLTLDGEQTITLDEMGTVIEE